MSTANYAFEYVQPDGLHVSTTASQTGTVPSSTFERTEADNILAANPGCEVIAITFTGITP